MPTYYDWLAAHPRWAQEQEAQQPFKNEAKVFTYLPRKDGDISSSQAAVTSTPPVNQYQPGAYYYPYPTTPSYIPSWIPYPVPTSSNFVPNQSTHAEPAQRPTYQAYPTNAGYYSPSTPVFYSPTTGSYPYYTQPPYYSSAPKPATSTLPDGTFAWYGRTRAEVEHDNLVLASKQKQDGGGSATQIKPASASPDQMFWVWEPDHVTKNMYSYATIERNFKGRWEVDPITGGCYFVRDKA